MSESLIVVRDVRTQGGDVERTEFAETPGGLELLHAAADVWGLVDGARSAAIRAIVHRVTSRPGGEVRFEREDCLELGELLRGADVALTGVVVDAQWALLPAVVIDLDRALPALVASRRGADRDGLVASGLSLSRGLANLFRKAVEQHAEVVLSS